MVTNQDGLGTPALPPEAIAAELHGTLVWKREDQGMWVALIRFDRQLDARLERGDDVRLAGRDRTFIPH